LARLSRLPMRLARLSRLPMWLPGLPGLPGLSLRRVPMLTFPISSGR